jgi:hypothetical protein
LGIAQGRHKQTRHGTLLRRQMRLSVDNYLFPVSRILCLLSCTFLVGWERGMSLFWRSIRPRVQPAIFVSFSSSSTCPLSLYEIRVATSLCVSEWKSQTVRQTEKMTIIITSKNSFFWKGSRYYTLTWNGGWDDVSYSLEWKKNEWRKNRIRQQTHEEEEEEEEEDSCCCLLLLLI